MDQDSVAIANLTRDVAVIGKNNAIVYVNVPPGLINTVKYIIKLQRHVGVPDENPFVFAKIGSKDEYRNTHPFFVKAAKESGAKKPHLLSSQGQRRHGCTEASVRDAYDQMIHIEFFNLIAADGLAT